MKSRTEVTAVEKMTARDVMTTEVLSVPDSWTVSRLGEFLVEEGISGAPVVDETGALVGVVSVTDIVRHAIFPDREAPSRHATHTYYMSSMGDRFSAEELEAFEVQRVDDALVRDIMTQTVFEVAADTSVSRIADMLITGRIHRVLVTDAGRIVGLVTALDLLAAVQGVA